ncbi:hypothetical protein Sjap_001881 [Stephania japonica]|uniref:Uncharacterized protein n=1 Tax=Stephania japonica TaxID=461633 RepID=A0AAP0KKS3_9MAGN
MRTCVAFMMQPNRARSFTLRGQTDPMGSTNQRLLGGPGFHFAPHIPNVKRRWGGPPVGRPGTGESRPTAGGGVEPWSGGSRPPLSSLILLWAPLGSNGDGGGTVTALVGGVGDTAILLGSFPLIFLSRSIKRDKGENEEENIIF